MRTNELSDDLEIKNTVDSSFIGGYDATLYVVKDDQQVAYLQYSVYRDEPAIKMIWVSPHYRRQKIAYRMLKELQSMFPESEIDWGYTTQDGTELKRSVPFTKRPNPEIIKKRTKLTAVHSKLRQLNYRLEKLQQDNPEKARAFVATVGDRWNKLNDLAYRLENELYGAKGEYSKFIAENSDDDLVSEFLKSISPWELRYYSIRDNCGPAALDMMYWAKKKGIDLTKHGGFFVADHVVYDKADFTKEMKIEFKHSGLDFNNPDDRKQFIETNPKYSEEWKKIPHFWLQDAQGNIYDPSGYIQFIKTGLSSDLDKSRYEPAKQGVAEGQLDSLVNADQAERNAYKKFVDDQTGGDWTLGAKLYAELKKRSADDIFGDDARLNRFMRTKFVFGKFTDKDWKNYWLLSQHADRYPSFQQQALNNIEKYLGQDNDYYRYLADRISCAASGQQKYGTQSICGKQGVAEKSPVAEDKNVTITLNQLYKGDFPASDELFWDYVRPSELDDPLTIRTLSKHKLMLMLLSQYRVEHIDEIKDLMDEDQLAILKKYISDPTLSQKIIVVCRDRIIDGNHRALAAAMKGVPIKYVDLADLEEQDVTEDRNRAIRGEHDGQIVLENPNDLPSFKRSLGNAIRGGVSQIQANTAIAKAKGEFKWKIGDIVYSIKTGKTYTITGEFVRKGVPMYLYKRNDDEEHGAFYAEKAHETLIKLSGDNALDEAELDPSGWGSTPHGKDIDYFGIRVQMRPSIFLRLAAPLDRSHMNAEVVKHMTGGGKIAPAMLYVKIPPEWEDGDFIPEAEVAGHEGRNRMMNWIDIHGDEPVQVNIIATGEFRRRDFTDEIIEELSKGMHGERGRFFVPGPLFDVNTVLETRASKRTMGHSMSDKGFMNESFSSKVADTAKHMYNRYKGLSYSAHQRATDHAISYESNTPQFRYWASVADEISRLEKLDQNKPKP